MPRFADKSCKILLCRNSFAVLQAARVQFDEFGLAVLVGSDGSSRWANAIFDIVVMWDPETQEHLTLQRSSQDLQLMSEFLGKHRAVSVNMMLAGTAQPVKLQAYRMAHATDGCQYFWSLSHLHTATGGKGPAGRWYHKHWKEWVKFVVDKMEVAAVHCRRAQVALAFMVVESR
jgi:hypothetical protein